MVVALFYRPNIPMANRLFKQIPDLVGDADLDLAIMRAECSIVMKSRDVPKILGRLRDLVLSERPRFKAADIADWDRLMKMRGRHLGRILLHYAAYHRYLCKEYYLGRLGYIDVDVKIHCIHTCLGTIAEIFIKIESLDLRIICAGVVVKIIKELLKEAEVIDPGKYESQPYLVALCFNYLAWIRLHMGKDQKCVIACTTGLNYLERFNGYQTTMLYGDLHANLAFASITLQRPTLVEKYHDKAKKIYEMFEDDKGMLKELEKIRKDHFKPRRWSLLCRQ